MKAEYPHYALMNLIQGLEERIEFARELGGLAEVKRELFDLYHDVEKELLQLKHPIEDAGFSVDYADRLGQSLNNLINTFPSSYGANGRGSITLQVQEKPTFKLQQEQKQPEIESALKKFKVISAFFIQLDFFNSDLVIIGPNGSGKTSLARHLTSHIGGNGVLIAAQRILTLPAYESIRSYSATAEHVKSIQIPDNESLNRLEAADEFGVLIEHLLADDSRALKQNRIQRDDPFPPPTKLQVLLMIWNSLFSHLQMSLPDDINIQAKKESIAFHVSEMSDGEKVALFLIAHVLLCPQNGFVIVDEPEMYLHPTIHKKLWNTLQSERSDARFIYLTHDLEFASSRHSAKKLWLRSFTFPDHFVLEEILQNEIPQALLMELLGSREDILFCEGEAGSLDEQVYNILLPNYTIKPVGGCLSVINFTKAFNKLPMSAKKAIGVIDGDFISQQRIESLRLESVFALAVAHVENLLMSEELLVRLAKELSRDGQVPRIKMKTLEKLQDEVDLEVAKHVSAKVDHYFKDSNVAAGNNADTIKANFEAFTAKVDINDWGLEYKTRINKIVLSGNYEEALKVFQSKGLASLANGAFAIRDFNVRAINLLRRDRTLQEYLRKYLSFIPM